MPNWTFRIGEWGLGINKLGKSIGYFSESSRTFSSYIASLLEQRRVLTDEILLNIGEFVGAQPIAMVEGRLSIRYQDPFVRESFIG